MHNGLNSVKQLFNSKFIRETCPATQLIIHSIGCLVAKLFEALGGFLAPQTSTFGFQGLDLALPSFSRDRFNRGVNLPMNF